VLTVEDRHRYDVDPDPNFHFEVDPDQNYADPHADPTPCFTHVEKSEIFFFTSPAAPVQLLAVSTFTAVCRTY
jgi:hypothetical protein